MDLPQRRKIHQGEVEKDLEAGRCKIPLLLSARVLLRHQLLRVNDPWITKRSLHFLQPRWGFHSIQPVFSSPSTARGYRSSSSRRSMFLLLLSWTFCIYIWLPSSGMKPVALGHDYRVRLLLSIVFSVLFVAYIDVIPILSTIRHTSVFKCLCTFPNRTMTSRREKIYVCDGHRHIEGERAIRNWAKATSGRRGKEKGFATILSWRHSNWALTII